MSEAIELRSVIDGAVLKGVRRWAQLENFTGGWPADYEPTTEELTTAAREMLAECAGRLGCEVCGSPGPGDYPRAGLSGNPFGMSEDRDSYFVLELDCDDGNLGGYLGAWAKDEAGWSGGCWRCVWTFTPWAPGRGSDRRVSPSLEGRPAWVSATPNGRGIMNESTSAREGGRRSDRRRRLGSNFKNRTPLDPVLSLLLRFFDLAMFCLWVVGMLFYALLAIVGIGDFGHFPAIAAETSLRGLRVYIPYRIFIYLYFRMSMRYESPGLVRDPGSGAEE